MLSSDKLGFYNKGWYRPFIKKCASSNQCCPLLEWWACYSFIDNSYCKIDYFLPIGPEWCIASFCLFDWIDASFKRIPLANTCTGHHHWELILLTALVSKLYVGDCAKRLAALSSRSPACLPVEKMARHNYREAKSRPGIPNGTLFQE